MANSVREKISSDLRQVKEVGQSRSQRIREILQAAVSEVLTEVKSGSGELRSLVRDAFGAAISGIQTSGSQAKEEITASVEGIVEGISQARQQRISETEAEVKRLQAQLDQQEDELEQEVETGLAGLKDASRDLSAEMREQIDHAIEAVRNSEEAALMRKRYAQLQAQASILRANLAARSGEYYDRAQGHLEDAREWYKQARPQAETLKAQADEKAAEFDAKIGEAGTALARRERKVKQILRDLLRHATEMFKDDHHDHRELPSKDISVRDRAIAHDVDQNAPELPPTKSELEDSRIER